MSNTDDFRTLMNKFEEISKYVDGNYPEMTEDERYKLKCGAMDQVLGFNSKAFADSLNAGDSLETARAKARK